VYYAIRIKSGVLNFVRPSKLNEEDGTLWWHWALEHREVILKSQIWRIGKWAENYYA